MSAVSKIEVADFKMPAQRMKFSNEEMALLKKTVLPKNCSPEEAEMFAMVCIQSDLNPFVKEIYLMDVGGKNVYVISIGGLRKIARKTGRFSPGKEHQCLRDKEGKLIGVRAFMLYKSPLGWRELSETAMLSEYAGRGGNWKIMPETMLDKCAQAKLIRRCLLEDVDVNIDQIYFPEELDHARKAAKEEEGINEVGQVIVDEVPEAKELLDDNELMELAGETIQALGVPEDQKYSMFLCLKDWQNKVAKPIMDVVLAKRQNPQEFLQIFNRWKAKNI
jgi:hypothetical protein